MANGAPAGTISAAGLGDSRPVGPNSTPEARKENSRVEIVISGNAIGKLPVWDKTYTVTPALSPADRR
jgi:hypothetical protein